MRAQNEWIGEKQCRGSSLGEGTTWVKSCMYAMNAAFSCYAQLSNSTIPGNLMKPGPFLAQ